MCGTINEKHREFLECGDFPPLLFLLRGRRVTTPHAEKNKSGGKAPHCSENKPPTCKAVQTAAPFS
jgi:hypothetical protein